MFLSASEQGLEPVSIAVAVSRGKRPDPTMVPQDEGVLGGSSQLPWHHLIIPVVTVIGRGVDLKYRTVSIYFDN